MFGLLQQVLLGLLAVIIWAVPAFAAERVVAAIVDRVSGENITYREKDGAEQSLRLLTQLHTGDVVYLPDSNDLIELLVGGSEHRSVVHRDSPYQVPSFGAPPSFLHNVFDGAVRSAIGSVAHLWGKEQERVGRVPAIARDGKPGGDLQAPIFSFAEQQVVAGDRAFSIGWEGGEPPYMVDIKREGHVEPIARQEGLSSAELYSTAVRLTPGRHKIVIRDRESNHILQQTFEVVAAGKEPRPSNPSAFADLPPDLGTTLAAVWLAAQDNGAWALESLQRTSGLVRSGYQPAVLLHNQLLYGGEAVELSSGMQ
jgi:hypothetical protein